MDLFSKGTGGILSIKKADFTGLPPFEKEEDVLKPTIVLYYAVMLHIF